MSEKNLVQIFNLINNELQEAPNEEQLSDKENEMYADMQNLKESLGEYFIDKIIEGQSKFNYTEKNLIGLNKYLYVFDNKKDFENAYKILEKYGQVVEVFIDNAYGFEFKENIKILDEQPKFSEESIKSIKSGLANYYKIETTIEDENISQIRDEKGDFGVELYEKYYDLYKENGTYEIYDFIDSFCYGNTTVIKQYLDEIIKYFEENKNIEKDEIIDAINEIEQDKEKLKEYEMKRENLQL